MRAFYKTLSIILIILFILAIGKAGFDLYNLEEDIAQALGILEAETKKKISPVALNAGIFVGLGFAFGLLAIMFQILGGSYFSNDNKPRVIYVEKNSDGTTTEVDASIVDAHTGLEDNIGEVEEVIRQNQGKIKLIVDKILFKACTYLQAAQGALYIASVKHGLNMIELEAGYAYFAPESQKLMYEFGEGLAGQVAKDGKTVIVDAIPEGYMTVISGLGNASPRYLIISPVRNNMGETLGVIEIASFEKIKESHKLYIEKVAVLLAEQLTSYPFYVEE